MAKKTLTQEQIRRTAIGLLDNRQVDNDGMLIQRDRTVTMLDIFGNEQKTAIAHFMSDCMAKGFDGHELIEAIRERYNVELKMQEINRMKQLLYKLWRCDTAHTMNDQIARQLAEIRVQKREAWKAWEASKETSIGKTHKGHQTSPAPEVSFDIDEEFVETHKNAGDVKFLQLVADLCKEERKLLGLYAPEKKQTNIGIGAGGGNVNVLIVGGDGNSLSGPAIETQQKPVIEEGNAEVIEDKEDDDVVDLFNDLMN